MARFTKDYRPQTVEQRLSPAEHELIRDALGVMWQQAKDIGNKQLMAQLQQLRDRTGHGASMFTRVVM
jgi:hypothetical protein